jgi:hypothetical protein
MLGWSMNRSSLHLCGTSTLRGYFVNAHANGDHDIGTFEGKVKTLAAAPTRAG